jgi:hypothetical protein
MSAHEIKIRAFGFSYSEIMLQVMQFKMRFKIKFKGDNVNLKTYSVYTEYIVENANRQTEK